MRVYLVVEWGNTKRPFKIHAVYADETVAYTHSRGLMDKYYGGKDGTVTTLQFDVRRGANITSRQG